MWTYLIKFSKNLKKDGCNNSEVPRLPSLRNRKGPGFLSDQGLSTPQNSRDMFG